MGCLLAQDMTNECLFAKLSYLIGKVSLTVSFFNSLVLTFFFSSQGYSSERIKLLMNTSLRGELTNATAMEEKFEFTNNDMVMGVAEYLNATDHDEINAIKKSLAPVLLNSVASTVSKNTLKQTNLWFLLT